MKDLVVAPWVSDGESRPHREILFLHGVCAASNHPSSYKIILTISMTWVLPLNPVESGVPLFLSDGDAYDLTAIVTPCGRWVQPPRHPARGPAPQLRWMPLPGLLYAHVVKQRRRRCLVAVKHRVVVGTQAAVGRVLAVCGWQTQTACVERLNRSRRQRVAAIGRRSATPCKHHEG
jgi:hypothetical protein